MELHDPSLPVHQAAKEGDIDVLNKATKKQLNASDVDGWTAVHWCAWSGHPEPLEAVLKKGANPNKIDVRGCTPLHIAATYGNSEAIDLLIEHKANIWSLDDRGLYPAKVAAFNKRLECCRKLDEISIHLSARNIEYVKQQQTKALKELEKRLKEKEKKKSSHTLPRTNKESTKKKKNRMTAENNFVLQRPGENDQEEIDNEDGEEEEDDDDELHDLVDRSGKNTLRPLPRIASGAMLNTLGDLARKPMNIEYPDDLQDTRSDHIIIQAKRNTQHKHLAKLIPLEGSFDMENDSPLITFLHSINLYEVAHILLKEKIDLEVLAACTDEDLKSIGLHLGPVKKIRKAVTQRNEAIQCPGPLTDTQL